ncbi:alpha/beta hydrolase [Verrucomicrobiaceae bacterium N1E253]|uniref:Alpha/beta hydrolase n=1 Tax=Oceaniferula marina TaxID=2748318 RepID=A0A851GIZ1_9BACT|nr:alpha/beta hydrolase [Oceaniferula marina]NWK54620.1 alpha/beta hydrolase [Oceaniferula marina]
MSLPAFQTLGNPNDPPLLFLHGLGAGKIQTTSAFPSLPHCFLIAPDMPGHGESQSYDPSGFSFDSFADLTVRLIRHLGIETLHLGGLSMGSGIALNIALRYPEMVHSLILLRPSWTDKRKPEHLKLVAWVGQWIEKLGMHGAREQLLQCPDFLILQTQNPPVADSILALFDRPETPASTAVLYKMWQDAPFHALSELQSIEQPTLILTTGRDELHPQLAADQIAANLRHHRSTALPARYHEPEAYHTALRGEVRDFLASNELSEPSPS